MTWDILEKIHAAFMASCVPAPAPPAPAPFVPRPDPAHIEVIQISDDEDDDIDMKKEEPASAAGAFDWCLWVGLCRLPVWWPDRGSPLSQTP